MVMTGKSWGSRANPSLRVIKERVNAVLAALSVFLSTPSGSPRLWKGAMLI